MKKLLIRLIPYFLALLLLISIVLSAFFYTSYNNKKPNVLINGNLQIAKNQFNLKNKNKNYKVISAKNLRFFKINLNSLINNFINYEYLTNNNKPFFDFNKVEFFFTNEINNFHNYFVDNKINYADFYYQLGTNNINAFLIIKSEYEEIFYDSFSILF